MQLRPLITRFKGTTKQKVNTTNETKVNTTDDKEMK